jgi:hypothetical protein
LEDPDLRKALKRQETFLHINHQNKQEPEKSRLLKYAILWAKSTYAINFAIKRKIDRDRELRANALQEKTSPTINGGGEYSEEEESPLPMIGTKAEMFSRINLTMMEGDKGSFIRKKTDLKPVLETDPTSNPLTQGGKHDVFGHLNESETSGNQTGSKFFLLKQKSE